MEQLALQQLAQVRLQDNQETKRTGAEDKLPEINTSAGRHPNVQEGEKGAESKPVSEVSTGFHQVAGSAPTDTAEKRANNSASLRSEAEPLGKRLGLYRHEAAVSLNFHTHA